MNEKIMFKAFELAGFNNPETLAEIIKYVPNPGVAAEMLLGIHEPLTLESFGIFFKHEDNIQMFEVTGIDELADRISYRTYTRNTIKGYYLTEKDYAEGNYTTEYPKGGNYHKYQAIPTEGYTVDNNSCQISDFVDSKYGKKKIRVENSDFVAWIEEAQRSVVGELAI